MSQADRIVSVTITNETRTPTQAGFGTPLIMAYHTVFPDRVREYSTLDELVDAGFSTDSAVYRMATQLLSQSPAPSSFKVGRRANAPTQSITLTPTKLDAGLTHTVTINGTEFTYTNDADPTVAEITAGLVAAINGGTEPVTASDNTTNIGLDADVAGVPFSVSYNGGTLADASADPGVLADLSAIREEDDDWYCLLLDSASPAEIIALDATIETLAKIAIFEVSDSDILDAGVNTDIASIENALGYDRTILIYSSTKGQYSDAAWAGNRLPSQPGTSTWAFKELVGVAGSDLTTGDVSALETKKCNFYTVVKGLGITRQGVAVSGEYIDNVRAIDWLEARIQERVLALLASTPKIPYTDFGVSLVLNEVSAQLFTAVQRQVLRADPAPSVTAPKVASISVADRANRTLPDVNFQGQLAGAIHKVIIRGRLTV